jgi:hypothetical protein
MQRPVPVQTPRNNYTYGECAADLRISLRTFSELVRKGLVETIEVSPGLRRITAAERQRLLSEGIRR